MVERDASFRHRPFYEFPGFERNFNVVEEVEEQEAVVSLPPTRTRGRGRERE